MPPKVKFTKEEIVNAALNVARVKGADAVTTREIASKLGVSTRPIFTYFKTMDEVKDEIRRAAEAVYRAYVEEGLRMEPPFLGFGMQYIRFAKEEPELYKLLFFVPSADGHGGTMAAMEYSKGLVRDTLQRIYHMDSETASRYFRDMWLVVHSLATLVVTGSCPYSEEELCAILTEFSISFCKACKEIPGFVKGDFDRDTIFRTLIEA